MIDSPSQAAFEILRQWPALHGLLKLAETQPYLQGVLLIGSLASGNADHMSDLDVVLVAAEGEFSTAWNAREKFHGSDVFASWDSLEPGGVAAGTHKWLTKDLVLVECVIAEPKHFRLAEPYLVAVGRAEVAHIFPPRAPVQRSEMTEAGLHPVEVAYDRLKSAIRSSGAKTGRL